MGKGAMNHWIHERCETCEARWSLNLCKHMREKKSCPLNHHTIEDDLYWLAWMQSEVEVFDLDRISFERWKNETPDFERVKKE